MKLGRWICIAALLTGGLPAMADTPEAARPAPATLDQAVQIISSVDRGEVYLGEAVNLTASVLLAVAFVPYGLRIIRSPIPFDGQT